ncbi:MAG: hypothetical protein KME17_31515 [Cyanosarcina radialis HA8281-LM2]|jgi:hypothetical protein|nr:hypothetical protein [Cyanosarcina radialis HA8281-LM2]
MSCQSPVSQIAVFLGPTLPRNQASALLTADYYPPARKGDIYRLIPSGVKTIVLIDGVFHSTPSVWQREIMEALAEGIQVIGASSMGALRAAELHRFGAIGCGTIFEWYRDGMIDGDDEVVLHHGGEEVSFYPMSEPLVNIRYTLLQAVRDRCLAPARAELLIAHAKELYYPQRSYRQLLQSPVLQDLSPLEKQQLEAYIRTRSVNLKRRDAIAALQLCGRLKPDRSRPPNLQSNTDSPWYATRFFLGGFFGGNQAIAGSEIMQRVWQDRDLQTKLKSKLSKDFFLWQWVKQNRVVCPPDYLEKFVRHHELEQGIDSKGEWLRANGLTPKLYRDLLSKRAAIDWAIRQAILPIQPSPPTPLPDWERGAGGGVRAKGFWQPDLGSDTDSDLGMARSERRLLLAWATQNGVSLPTPLIEPCLAQWEQKSQIQPDVDWLRLRGLTRSSSREQIIEQGLVDWIIQQGPDYFGLFWDFDTALLNELQISGYTKQLMADMEAVC